MLLQVCLNCSIQESRNDPLFLLKRNIWTESRPCRPGLESGATSFRKIGTLSSWERIGQRVDSAPNSNREEDKSSSAKLRAAYRANHRLVIDQFT